MGQGEPLVMQAMRGRMRLAPAATLVHIRNHAAIHLAPLPEPLCQLQEPYEYRVEISGELRELARRLDRRSSIQ